ncbi:MAG: cell division protein ZapA [Prevotellaceae bacterium]|jgi:cell division protein ZapA (FtsZ GTPase activity inhibitor)|nr:cell division protein ZapA [Prevotellaceae bacterium]
MERNISLWIAERKYPMRILDDDETESKIREAAKRISAKIGDFKKYTKNDFQDKLVIICLDAMVRLLEYEPLELFDQELGQYLEQQCSFENENYLE